MQGATDGGIDPEDPSCSGIGRLRFGRFRISKCSLCIAVPVNGHWREALNGDALL
jgi:hypothetical protein